jgi:hypothetical protein
MGNHSHDESNYETSGDSVAVMQADMETARDILIGLGQADGALHMAYPGGGYNDDVVTAAVNAGMLTARSTQAELISTSTSLYQPLGLFGTSFDSGERTPAQVLAFVDDAKKYGKSIVIFGHGVVAAGPSSTEITIANLTILLDGLVTRRDNNQIELVNQVGWYNGLDDVISGTTEMEINEASIEMGVGLFH